MAEPANRMIYQQGWATSIDEFVSGVASISSTVYGPAQDQLFALCLSFPAMLMTDELQQQLTQHIYHHATHLGVMAGDPYWLHRATITN